MGNDVMNVVFFLLYLCDFSQGKVAGKQLSKIGRSLINEQKVVRLDGASQVSYVS